MGIDVHGHRHVSPTYEVVIPQAIQESLGLQAETDERPAVRGPHRIDSGQADEIDARLAAGHGHPDRSSLIVSDDGRTIDASSGPEGAAAKIDAWQYAHTKTASASEQPMKLKFAKTTSQGRKLHVTGAVLGLEEEALQSAGDLFRVVAGGVSVDRFRKLAEFGVPAAALEAIIPRRTLTHRTQNGQPLNLGESTSAAYTALMLSEAIDTFGDREVALEWLGAPKVFLDGKAPFEMLNNIPAIQEVRNRIGQIDSGYFA